MTRSSIGRLAISASPFYHPGSGEGENIARLAAGVQRLWFDTHGQVGLEAGFRLVQAGFHFRSALMGMKRAEVAGTAQGDQLKAVLGEREDQLLAFSGAKEAITALASTLDLTAAAIYRLDYGARDDGDAYREHDLASFPADSVLRKPLQPEIREWMNGVKSDNEMERLKKVRDMFTHRYFPRHLTIGAAFDQHVDLEGRHERLGDLLEDFSGFVVDRLVALSTIYHAASVGDAVAAAN